MPEKSWENCEWFTDLNKCPNSKEELMIQLRDGVLPYSVGGGTYDSSKGPGVNKRFCNNCDSYLERQM